MRFFRPTGVLVAALLGAVEVSCVRVNESKDSTGATAAAATGQSASANGAAGNVVRAPWGKLADGTPVDGFTFHNAKGMTVHAITYGGIITSLTAPDRNGKYEDVVLGFDSLPEYPKLSPYFGAIVGRYANRIANGRFTIDGTTYQLPQNDGKNTLHGGTRGLDKVVWKGEPFDRGSERGVVFTYTSPDGDQGFPGNLALRVTYTLDDSNHLTIDYHATTDKATPINISNHSYFNLTGGAKRDVLAHTVTIDAGRYTPIDSTLIPTGELASVDGTPFDFRQPTAIGARIGASNQQLVYGRGYDHNWVLDHPPGAFAHAVHVEEPTSGRTLDMSTDQPGVQFYTGNFLDGSIHGKGGRVYAHRFAFCLESQHFPDSPNHPNFPSTILRPGQEFNSRTVFAFGVVGK